MIEILETSLFYAVRFFSSALEMLFAFLLMNALFEDRYISRIPKAIAFSVSSAILLTLQERGQTGNIKTAVEMLLIVAIAFLIYDGKKRLRAIFAAVFSLCLALSKVLSYFAFYLFIDRLVEELPLITKEDFFYRLLSIELPNIIMLVLILLLGMFSKKKSKNIPLRYWLLLSTVPVTTLVTLTVYQYYIDILPPGESINLYIIVSAIGLVFINILVFSLFSRLQNQLELQRESDLLSTQMRLEKESFKKLEESYNFTREFRHDIKNHILSLRGIAQNGTKEELLKYLDTMTDVVEESSYISVSGNSAVDAVLNEKLLKCRKANISTQFDVKGINDCGISPMDLCTVISNALDNSIEANLKVEDVTNRYVNLKISAQTGTVIISVKNPTTEEPKKRAGDFLSTKKDRENHGLGLKSVKRTVEKYKGDMLTKIVNNEFNLIVSLPLK